MISHHCSECGAQVETHCADHPKAQVDSVVAQREQAKVFLDGPTPTGDRDSRREAINDYVNNAETELDTLRVRISQNDLAGARRTFNGLKGWVKAIGENMK